MAHHPQWSVYLLLSLYLLVETIPTCQHHINTGLQVVCENMNVTDYILNRGLVSDNNKTTGIYLQGCRVAVIELESFVNLKLGTLDGLKHLTYLNLSYNLLKDLELSLFDQIPYLDTLDLGSNRIEDLKLGLFNSLSKLKHVDLSNNLLSGKDLNAHIFERSRRINYIDFSHNDMNDSPENLLHAFEVLEYLLLKNCRLKEVPTFATRKNIASLKHLILADNLISKLDNATLFSSFENLKKLDLSNNSIELMHTDVFKPLNKLNIILLRGNKIYHLPETLFHNMKSLSKIDLSNNFIQTVPIDAFLGASLKELNLSMNRFTNLPENFCSKLRKSGAILTKFYFNLNPWQCFCFWDIWVEVNRLKITHDNYPISGPYPICVTSTLIFCKRYNSINSISRDFYDALVASYLGLHLAIRVL